MFILEALHIRESYPVHRKRELHYPETPEGPPSCLDIQTQLQANRPLKSQSSGGCTQPSDGLTASGHEIFYFTNPSSLPAPPQSHVQTIWTAHKAEDNFRAFPRACLEAFQSFLSVKSDALFLYTCKKMKSVSIPFYLQNEMGKLESLT